MAQPTTTPKTGEFIAGEAMRDIAGNVSGKAEWRDYDERYVVQRILRAIREAKGTAAILTLCLLPLTGHAQTYKGEAIHKIVVAYCIGSTLHPPPCASDDVGFVDDQTRVHFTKAIPEAEMCAILHRLRYQ